MKNAHAGGAGADQAGDPDHTAAATPLQPSTRAPDPRRAARAIAVALIALPDLPPGRAASDLACTLRARLDPSRRLWLAGAAVEALDPEHRQLLIEAAQPDLEPPWPLPGVDSETFRRVCREHRPPPLTLIQKRRATAIAFDDSPREILAAAWVDADDIDRRDLIQKATRRAAQ